jgi:hypothetical protein
MGNEMKLLVPDSCWRKDLVSGALFLYFHEQPISLTLHPSVSTFMTGADPFSFFRVVEERRPKWGAKFFQFVQLWTTYIASVRDTDKLLEPLRGKAFKTVWLSYDRGAGAWESACELLGSSSLAQRDIVKLIDPFSAADELFSHIFFEKFLELYHTDYGPDDFAAMGRQVAESGEVPPKVNVDWSPLYHYCDEAFGSSDLDVLLTRAYMFRMPLLFGLDTLFLSNECLITFLASLPIESVDKHGATSSGKTGGSDDLFDAVAWEFFRQLVSPVLDPINEEHVGKICQLNDERPEEIRRLKSRCLALAHELGEESDFDALQKRIRNHIRVNVEKEVQDVVGLERQALTDLFNAIFSDEKTWLGISGLLYSLINGGPILTAGSAIYALSVFGSKAFKAAATKREKLKASDYALLYRVNQQK